MNLYREINDNYCYCYSAACDNGGRPSVPRSSHAVCLGMSKFVKRHLSAIATVGGSGIPLFRYRRLIKYYVFSLGLSYSTCFPTVAVRSTCPRPAADRNCRSDIDMTIPDTSTYKSYIHLHMHFPSLFPPLTFNDSINDRLHG